MGKLKEFSIGFVGEKVIYQPGDVIAGNLLVRLISPMKTEGIKIQLTGYGYVHWSEEQGSGDNRHTVHYRGKEVMLNETICVFGKETGEHNDSLSQGEHIYPFSYRLPENLPTSYEDRIGRIRYEVHATIQRSWKFDRRTRRIVTVLATLDTNDVKNAMVPAVGTETKHLCCWCCKSGPIKAEFQADRSAYVPGEFVTINATLKNKSNSKVKTTSASLMQRITYRATRKTKIRWIAMASVIGEECPKGKTITWANKRLQIPPVPPTSNGISKVLDIEYFLMFQGHLRMCAVDLREYEEITIGTVPLKNLDIYSNWGAEQATTVETGDQIVLPSAVGDGTVEQATTAPAFAPPRPIYKAATEEGVNLTFEDDEANTTGDTVYSPQYAYYDWSQPAFTY